jgi:hypothetical protein
MSSNPEVGSVLTLRLSAEALRSVDWLAQARGGLSRAEAIGLALSDELFFVKAACRGQRVFVEESASRPGREKPPGRLNVVQILDPR